MPASLVPPRRLRAHLLAPLLAALTAAAPACSRAQAGEGFPDTQARRRAAVAATEVAASDPAAEFSSITALDVDSRGRIYVGDWYRQQVTVLGPDGALLRTIGRKGAGPGEFESIRGIQVLRGDSLQVYDPNLARVTVYAPEAERPAYSRNLGPQLRGEAPFHLWRTREGDGFVALVRPQFAFMPGRSAPERRDAVDALGPDGAARARGLLTFPSKSFLVAETSVTPNPFGREGIVRLDARDRLWYVWNDSASVARYDLAGRRDGGFPVPFQAPPVRPADVDRELGAMNDWTRRTFARVLRDSVPQRWPAVRDLLVDDAGRVWLALAGDPAEAAEWARFGEDGRYAGSVLVPPAVRLLAVRGGLLYGQRKDDADVPRVVVLRARG